jgi:hypothetical protein
VEGDEGDDEGQEGDADEEEEEPGLGSEPSDSDIEDDCINRRSTPLIMPIIMPTPETNNNNNNKLHEHKLHEHKLHEHKLHVHYNKLHVHYNKLSYTDVLNQINKSYEQDIVHRYSSALDILASYIKGQKTIYMETRTYTQTILNFLMIPSIFLSGLITVLQPNGANYPYVLSALSAGVTCLLAIINYSKLDGAAEAHKIAAYQYDKLQTFIEFQSGQVLLFGNPILNNENMTRYCAKQVQQIKTSYDEGDVNEQAKTIRLANAENNMLNSVYQERLEAEADLINNMREIMLRIETDIATIKETNQFIIPQKIRHTYLVLYNTNVFSVIKKIDDYRAKTLTELKHVKNELRYIQAAQQAQETPSTKYNKRSAELFQQKKKIINIILFLNTAFSMIDKMFQQEILNAKMRQHYWCRFYFYDIFHFTWLLPPKYIEPEVSGGEIFEKILGFDV